MEATEFLEPPIEDGHGYRVRVSDLVFVQLNQQDMEAFYARRRPLGMSEESFQIFVSCLENCLKRDDITSADVRLKGSSTRFFSGDHKVMPYSREEVMDLFLSAEGQGDSPLSGEIDLIMRKIERIWPEGSRPYPRPFDSLYRLGVARRKSDYDLQISSDEIYERARSFLESNGIDLERIDETHPKYAFLRSAIADEVCQALALGRLKLSRFLGRDVGVAAFPSAGPPMRIGRPGESLISSHFKSTDWCLSLSGQQP